MRPRSLQFKPEGASNGLGQQGSGLTLLPGETHSHFGGREVAQWGHRNLPRSCGPFRTPQSKQQPWSLASLQVHPCLKEPCYWARGFSSWTKLRCEHFSPLLYPSHFSTVRYSDNLTQFPTHLTLLPISTDVAPNHLCYFLFIIF